MNEVNNITVRGANNITLLLPFGSFFFIPRGKTAYSVKNRPLQLLCDIRVQYQVFWISLFGNWSLPTELLYLLIFSERGVTQL